MRVPSKFLVLLVASLGAQAPAHAASPRPELEVGAGVAVAVINAPVVGARAGLDFGNLVTLSARGFDILGGKAAEGNLQGTPGFQAWALFPELRLHSGHPKRQFYLGLGAGVGRLVDMLGTADETPPYEGRTGFYGQLSLGGRWMTEHLSLGAEASVSLFTQVSGGHFIFDNAQPPSDHQRIPALLFQVTVGFR